MRTHLGGVVKETQSCQSSLLGREADKLGGSRRRLLLQVYTAVMKGRNRGQGEGELQEGSAGHEAQERHRVKCRGFRALYLGVMMNRH